MVIRKTIEVNRKKIILETGKLARQADGAVVVQCGGTVVLATAVASREPLETVTDFFPLSVEYREKAYAAGKIPGGFFKREGKPQEKEVLSARLIDRSLRPLFPQHFPYEVQVVVTVLSSDKEQDADVLGIVAASAALCISDIPFNGPISGVRVGRVNGKMVLNPSFSELDISDLNIVVAGSEDAILMVEGETKEVTEEDLLSALEYAHDTNQKIVQIQKELMQEVGKAKRPVEPREENPELFEAVRQMTLEKLSSALSYPGKKLRRQAIDDLLKEIQTALAEKYPEQELLSRDYFTQIQRQYMREMILNQGKRIDGRGYDDLREITCEISVLPRTHGSALFTRGETQSLTVTTLGTKVDEQKIEGLEGESWKSYMLHYNFPPFSVGEVKAFRGPSRREIGHGNLAERALKPVIPGEGIFPYTIRIVSDILESNGSSSMATVCAGSLSLMDAGVPIKSAVAGVAMGLVKEGEKTAILTDILGDEDHLGDMDFKVTGTRRGITALQMDIKIQGISSSLLREALEKARIARMKILDIMDKAISVPKKELSPYAPRILTMKVDVDLIGAIIGPGGKTIREISEKSGAEIFIEDDGTVQIAGLEEKACQLAKQSIELMIQKPELGKVYKGRVTRTTNFGAFVEFLPGKEGLLHISEIEPHRIARVEDVLKVGDETEVKLMGVTAEGKYELSRKILLTQRGSSNRPSDHKSRFPRK